MNRPQLWLLLVLLVVALSTALQSAQARVPDIDARAALIVDADDGKVLYSKAANRKLAIASLTKLMTALLVLEQVPLQEKIAAAAYAPQPAESKIDLRAGELMKVEDLLYALLLASANDAAQTFAERLAGSDESFVTEMNRKARQLGLKNTRFANPIGLDDPDNYSSANDLAKLTRKLMSDRSFRRIVRTPEKTIKSGDRQRMLVNRNRLVGQYRFVNGVKTGRTAASGYSLVGSGTKKGVNLVTVLLGAGSEAGRDAGTLELFKYGFGQFKTVLPVRKGQRYGSVEVSFKDEKVRLGAARNLSVQLRRGQRVRVVTSNRKKVDQTDRGGKMGTVTVLVEGKNVASTKLVATSTVKRAGLLRKGVYYLTMPVSLILLLVVLAVGGVIAKGRTRQSANGNDDKKMRAE